MSKRSTKLIVLLACLIVVGSVSFFVISSENAKNATATESTEATQATYSVFSVETADITRIYWYYSDWIEKDLSLIDGSWVAAESPETDLIEEQVEDFLAYFGDIQAYKEYTAENLQDYGLAEPAARVHIEMKDGTEAVIDFGDSTTVSGYCYMRVNESGPVYIVSRVVKSNLVKVLTSFSETTTAIE